jgi:transcriptional regulator with XRE-family HTH domain
LDTRQIIGQNIRGYRRILGLSQKEFAKLARINNTYLASIERGKKNLTIDTIIRIASVIGVPEHILLVEGAFEWNRHGNRRFS